MSLSSKPRKVKAKGAVRELKIVQSVSRRGADTLKAEEVTTPRRETGKAPKSSHPNQTSSPRKRLKLSGFDGEPIPCHFEDHFEGHDDHDRRSTLVFLSFPIIMSHVA